MNICDIEHRERHFTHAKLWALEVVVWESKVKTCDKLQKEQSAAAAAVVCHICKVKDGNLWRVRFFFVCKRIWIEHLNSQIKMSSIQWLWHEIFVLLVTFTWREFATTSRRCWIEFGFLQWNFKFNEWNFKTSHVSFSVKVRGERRKKPSNSYFYGFFAEA